MLAEKKTKRKIVLLSVWVGLLTLLCIVFICLYVMEHENNFKTALRQFNSSISEVTVNLTEYEQSGFDAERYQNIITSELNGARISLFLMDTDEDNMVALNRLYFAYIRYPKDMQAYNADIVKALKLLQKDYQSEEGYKIISDSVNGMLAANGGYIDNSDYV